MTTQRRQLHLTQDDQNAQRYYEVPFEVTGAESVEIKIDFDGSAAVVDLGCEDPHQWRGWSGGARRRFVIEHDAATPGYLPGELPDGTWSVILGLHRLPAEGIDVSVEISIPAQGPVEATPPRPPATEVVRASRRDLPAPDGLRWYAGDFHAHTFHSDGNQSIEWLAAHAAERSLDFLAVTDHNTISHHQHLPAASARYGTCLIPGQEVTTARGHANAFGDIGWIDFRRPAAEWVDDVADRGGIMSINHPLEADCAWLHELPVRPQALEFWHSSWFRDLRATFPWASWPLWDPQAVLIGGSDFHRPGDRVPVGTPTTWVAATECTPEAILEGVGLGRTAITAGPEAPALVRVGDDLVAIEADGTWLVDVDGRATRISGQRVTLNGDKAGRGPFHLRAGDGSLVAISA